MGPIEEGVLAFLCCVGAVSLIALFFGWLLRPGEGAGCWAVLPGRGDGGGLEIGFNNRYLMDALKAAPADQVRLELTSGVSPCVILPAEGEENFLYMVLPVRLKAGE